MANAKIISFVDAEVASVMRLTARDIAAARDRARHDVAFVAANLRHEINTLAATVAVLRDANNTLAAAVNQLRADVDALKQGHQAVGGLHSVHQLKQGGGVLPSG